MAPECSIVARPRPGPGAPDRERSGADGGEPRIVGESGRREVAQPRPGRAVAGQLRPAGRAGRACRRPGRASRGRGRARRGAGGCRGPRAGSRGPGSRRPSRRGTGRPRGGPRPRRARAGGPRRGRRPRAPPRRRASGAPGRARLGTPAARRASSASIGAVARDLAGRAGATPGTGLEDAEGPLERLGRRGIARASRAAGRRGSRPGRRRPRDSASSSARRATSQASASRPSRSRISASRSSVSAASARRPERGQDVGPPAQRALVAGAPLERRGVGAQRLVGPSQPGQDAAEPDVRQRPVGAIRAASR